MDTKDINEIRAALEIVRKSQDIEFRLRAVISVSAGSGVRQYLRRTKRELIFSLFASFLKVWKLSIVIAISSVISKAIFVLREMWLDVTGKSVQ